MPGRLSSPGLVFTWLLAIAYTSIQFAGNWVFYSAARCLNVAPTPNPSLTVDIFITAYKESDQLIEQALAAALAVHGPHRTWLLDDRHSQTLAALAAHMGAGYLMRYERTDAKAGNINSALQQTKGDIIAVFDVDHFPEPNFLVRTLGYFNDPRVGFVQCMLMFRNQGESWVARSSAESALDFYYPTSIGADNLGAATMIGTNSLIRRSALASIDGYRAGLADDLATSAALTAAGWEAAYVAEPLAYGLTPPDLPAWFLQQFKWARGVAEVVITSYPRIFHRLNWAQRISYSLRGSYYLFGFFVAAHFALTLIHLYSGDQRVQLVFEDYLLHLFPLTLMVVLVRQTAVHTWNRAETSSSGLLRLLIGAIHLIYATWPIYMIAWVLAIFRIPVSYRPTPKNVNGHFHPLWVAPQFVAMVLLFGAAINGILMPQEERPWLLILFALAQCVPLAVVMVESISEGLSVANHRCPEVASESIKNASEAQ